MHSNAKIKLLAIENLNLDIIAKLVFILALIIDVKVIKINCSFLSIYQDICLYNNLYF